MVDPYISSIKDLKIIIMPGDEVGELFFGNKFKDARDTWSTQSSDFGVHTTLLE